MYILSNVRLLAKELAAKLRGSRPRVQSASLYDNFDKLSHYDVTDDVITRKL